MSQETQFVDGLIVKAPHPKAPDFVKAQIAIKVEDLGLWLRQQHKDGKEWVNVDVKVSKSGKWYAAVSEWKKEEKAQEPKKDRGASGFDDLNDPPF